jgi:hypothetical protein
MTRRSIQLVLMQLALLCATGKLCAVERFHIPLPLPNTVHLASLPEEIIAPVDAPPTPPAGEESDQEYLPPLEEELYLHGGSYLYQAEGDRLGWPEPCEPSHHELLRLPEDWLAPQPFTRFAPFLGTGPIQLSPHFEWPGCGGYSWEPRLVGHGSYQLFGFALEQNKQRQDVIGHQLLVDLDLQLTGTERFHMQFRPLGEKNTGGSFYQFSDPAGYVDNSTGVPDRYWFECEIASVLGAYLDPNAARDYNLVVGKFPYILHNNLLLNDDILGFVLSQNNNYVGRLSNLNWQIFAGFSDVDSFTDADASLYGTHVSLDRRHDYYEMTYAYLQHELSSDRDSHYVGLSRTSKFGLWNYAARAFFKWGDQAGRGDGQLYVLESNRERYFAGKPLGFESGVFYANAFYATQGWSSISGGNFNRLRLAFESNPLIRIAAAPPVDDTFGAALGVRLTRHHADEALIPELSYQAPDGNSVWGLGLRYQRKTGPRSFFELLGILNYSDDDRYDREGVFVSETIQF